MIDTHILCTHKLYKLTYFHTHTHTISGKRALEVFHDKMSLELLFDLEELSHRTLSLWCHMQVKTCSILAVEVKFSCVGFIVELVFGGESFTCVVMVVGQDTDIY